MYCILQDPCLHVGICRYSLGPRIFLLESTAARRFFVVGFGGAWFGCQVIYLSGDDDDDDHNNMIGEGERERD